LQDRRSALGGISRLAQGQADALTNLGVSAEAQRNARFSQLGGAAQMKAAQDKYLFDINEMTPYNRMLALKQMKAQSANARQAAGLQTLAGGLSNAANAAMFAQGSSPAPTGGTSSQDTFNSWMQDQSLKPQLNKSLIQSPSLTKRRLYGASTLIPNSYTN
jgi:hypothetical protein